MEQQSGSSSADGRGKPVRVGVIGVGEFGASLAIRDRHTQAVSVCAFADLDVEQAQARLVRAGLSRDSIEVCDSRPQAVAALERGARVLTADASLLPGLPIDILVDSTGHPEAAARMAEASIANGLHVAMASKECDSVIGPLLYRKARAAGVVYTPVDGDQPSLLMKLIGWSRELGLKIVAAG
ncbi:MAG: homoserine dehydrogenase, partial [Burkholderiaceae bacterium]